MGRRRAIATLFALPSVLGLLLSRRLLLAKPLLEHLLLLGHLRLQTVDEVLLLLLVLGTDTVSLGLVERLVVVSLRSRAVVPLPTRAIHAALLLRRIGGGGGAHGVLEKTLHQILHHVQQILDFVVVVVSFATHGPPVLSLPFAAGLAGAQAAR